MKLHDNKTTRYYAELYYDRLKYDNRRTIDEVYGIPSQRKRAIEHRILRDMQERNGMNYTVLTHNAQFLTCAYEMPDPETGEIILCIETPSNTLYTSSRTW